MRTPTRRADSTEGHGRLYLLLALAVSGFLVQMFMVPRIALAERTRAARLDRSGRPSLAPATSYLTREDAARVVTGGRDPVRYVSTIDLPASDSEAPRPTGFTWAGFRKDRRAGSTAKGLAASPSIAPGGTAGEPDAQGERGTGSARPAFTQAGSEVSSVDSSQPAASVPYAVGTPAASPENAEGATGPESDAGDAAEEDADSAPLDEADPVPADPEAGTPLVGLLGDAYVQRGNSLTILVTMEAARGVAHAPLRLSWNPDVLELEEAREGTFLSSDGAATQFLAVPDPNPGAMEIVLSRIPPAGGLTGNGTLCEIVLRAHGEGESPIVLTGSRLLDAKGKNLRFRRSETHVAVN